jgi:6-phosphogluconolactonase
VNSCVRITGDWLEDVTLRLVLARQCVVSLLIMLVAHLVACGSVGRMVPTTPIAPAPPPEFLYVTNYASNNLSAFSIDTATGVLTPVVGSPFTAGTGPNAAAVASGKFLYVGNSTSNNVSGYTIDQSSGALTSVPGSPFAAGTGPQAIAVDSSAKFVYVTNFWSANISAYSINATTGALSPVPGSQFGSGGTFYGITADPAGKFVYVSDNGFLRISAFAIDATSGVLTAVPGGPFPAGSNPLGLVVHPSGKFLYVTDVPPASNGNVLACSIDGTTGALAPLTGSPFAVGPQPLAVSIEPQGKFAYVSLIGGRLLPV